MSIRPFAAFVFLLTFTSSVFAADRPNVLWLTIEDLSPHLGCYGDDYACSPNIDALAKRSVRYTHAYAPIGVCAPARSTLITCMWPQSIGSQHMRSRGKLPEGAHFYPWYLHKAGYYTTNNSKTDYNLPMDKDAWDECGGKAHYKKRKPGQPFFAIFNFTTTHESKIWPNRAEKNPPGGNHAPAKAPIPPYHPRTKEVRRDWAQLYDKVAVVDKQIGDKLMELEQAGLADDTIVFFYSDHGTGMPRSKRWLYESSTRVPLIIHVPEKFKHLAPGQPGSVSDRMVNFIDFGPTLLSLCGVDVPKHMHGRAFLGEQNTEPKKYIHGFRDRMDERYDLIRSVRDRRFRYIRNFHPELPWAQHISYMYKMPTMRVWQKMHDEGTLTPVQDRFFQTKPVEELYDTANDPHEINNLAGDEKYRDKLLELRGEMLAWMLKHKDLGLLPEADMNRRFGNKPPYDAVRADPESVAFDDILKAIRLADFGPEKADELIALADHNDPAVRYWVAVGLLRTDNRTAASIRTLEKMLTDEAPNVRIDAANALARFGQVDKALPVLIAALKHENEYVQLAAINHLDHLDEQARPALEAMKAAKKSRGNVSSVAQKAVADLEEK